jgi:hypothetical protein
LFIAFVASESAVVGCTLPHPPFFLPWGLNAIFRTFFAPSENHVICKPLAGAPRPSSLPVALGCQRFVSFLVPSESNALGNPGHHHVRPSGLAVENAFFFGKPPATAAPRLQLLGA